MIHNGDVNNTMNVTVNVVAFGKEDMTRIDKSDILKALKCGFDSTVELTRITHFNPKYPEYHNIYFASMKNKYAMVYDGYEWSLAMKEEVIDKMYDTKRNYIEENMDDFLDSLTKRQIEALNRWLAVDDDNDYIKKVKNDLKLMFYNNRKML